MSSIDIFGTAEKLKRSTSNRDVIAVCDALMELLADTSKPRKRAPNGTFDKRAYQRELMRKRRQAEKKGKTNG